MKLVAPRYEIPSRRYFSEKIIPSIYDKMKSSITELLQHVTSISFTSDIWSDPHANNSYISLSGHFINHDYTRKDIRLNVKNFPGHHTGIAISNTFHEILEFWKIPASKCHLLLRDNAANITLGAELTLLNSEGCFIHTLQLALKDGIFSQRSVKDIIAICRNIVKHFSHSPLACGKLNEIQKELGIPEHKLIQDVTTRWNSTFYMLEQLHEQRRAIGMFVKDHGGIQNLSNYHWELTENILRTLQPFEEVQKIFCSNIVSIAEEIVEIRVILFYLCKKDKDKGVQTMREILRDAIEFRFVNKGRIYERKNFTFATLLDPRFKNSLFDTKQGYLDNIQKEIILEIMQTNQENQVPISDVPIVGDSGGCSSPKNKRLSQEIHESISICFEEILQQNSLFDNEENLDLSTKNCSSSLYRKELELYINLPLISRSSDPLLWWKTNAYLYPNLVKLAKKYLCAPPTSIYSERLFSTAGIIFEEKRSKLLPENGESLIFIQKNLPPLDFTY